MWWIVGAVAALLGLILFVRSRAKARHTALVAAAQNHLHTSFVAFSGSLGEYDDRIWTDNYLLGYMQGIVSMVVGSFGESMDIKQKGMVYVDVLRGLKPEGWRVVAERTRSLVKSNDLDFQRGVEHAANAIGLITNQLAPEFRTEPDIQAALDQGPEIEELAEMVIGKEDAGSASPHSGAGAALMTIYMNRHKDLLDA